MLVKETYLLSLMFQVNKKPKMNAFIRAHFWVMFLIVRGKLPFFMVLVERFERDLSIFQVNKKP